MSESNSSNDNTQKSENAPEVASLPLPGEEKLSERDRKILHWNDPEPSSLLRFILTDLCKHHSEDKDHRCEYEVTEESVLGSFFERILSVVQLLLDHHRHLLAHQLFTQSRVLDVPKHVLPPSDPAEPQANNKGPISIAMPDELRASTTSFLDSWNVSNFPSLGSLISISNDLNEIFPMMDDTKGWTSLSTYDSCKLSYRLRKDSYIFTFKLDGNINAPLLNTAAVLYELDLYTKWFPLCKSVKVYRDATVEDPFHKIVSVRMGAPWPFSDREMVIDGVGSNCFNELGCMLLRVKSITKSTYVEIPPESDAVRIDFPIGAFRLTPITENQCNLTFLINIDLKIPVPMWAVNWISGHIVHLILHRIEGQARFDPKASDNEYAKRIAEKPVYKYINAMIHQGVKNSKAKPDPATNEKAEASTSAGPSGAETNSNSAPSENDTTSQASDK